MQIIFNVSNRTEPNRTEPNRTKPNQPYKIKLQYISRLCMGLQISKNLQEVRKKHTPPPKKNFSFGNGAPHAEWGGYPHTMNI